MKLSAEPPVHGYQWQPWYWEVAAQMCASAALCSVISEKERASLLTWVSCTCAFQSSLGRIQSKSSIAVGRATQRCRNMMVGLLVLQNNQKITFDFSVSVTFLLLVIPPSHSTVMFLPLLLSCGQLSFLSFQIQVWSLETDIRRRETFSSYPPEIKDNQRLLPHFWRSNKV